MASEAMTLGQTTPLRRVVMACLIGTTIEWYDFFLYGSAAALVFPRLFFSELDPFVAAMLSWFTFYAGFVGRPLGAALFGHFRDRIGRKAPLVTTMLLMGLSTSRIGLVPPDAPIAPTIFPPETSGIPPSTGMAPSRARIRSPSPPAASAS